MLSEPMTDYSKAFFGTLLLPKTADFLHKEKRLYSKHSMLGIIFDRTPVYVICLL